MTRQIEKHKKAFTLIEIIVVIAIVGVLSAIALPSLSGFAEKARIKADQGSLDTLNKATILYRASNNISTDDVFADVNSEDDEDRMQILVEDGLLEEVIKAQQNDREFTWDIVGQKWGLLHKDADLAMTGDQATRKGFKFEINDNGGYTITNYEGSDKNVKIPYMIDGVLVTVIGDNAFEGKGLTSVIIPDTIKTIKRNAFKNNKLKTVKIPHGLGTLYYSAFENNELISVDLSSLATIGHYAFRNNQLKSISFPSSVKVLGKNAFEKNQLEKIIIPDTVRDIEQEVFIKNKITSIEIQGKPEKIINSNAFNENGPGSDINFTIEVEDCPCKLEMNLNGDWIKISP